jgi:hypothetical protein
MHANASIAMILASAAHLPLKRVVSGFLQWSQNQRWLAAAGWEQSWRVTEPVAVSWGAVRHLPVAALMMRSLCQSHTHLRDSSRRGRWDCVTGTTLPR